MHNLKYPTAISNSPLVTLPVNLLKHSDQNKKQELANTVNDTEVKELPSLSVNLLERRITCMTVPAIVEAVHTACIKGKRVTVASYNAHSFNLSMQLPWYYEFLQSAEIARCDSVGILKAIGYMGVQLPIEYRASQTVLMPKILEKCNEHGLSVFLLGTKPNILETALERLRQQYPKAIFAGHHGYFDKEDPQQNEAVIEQINQVKPNILVVGMGMPIQEGWVYRHRSRLEVNAVMVGGAIIDRLAGMVEDCPPLISNTGLEWLYRLLREPKRLAVRYLLGNPAFALHIALAKFYAPPLRVKKMSAIDSYGSKQDGVKSPLATTSSTTNQELSTDIYSRVKRIADYFVEADLLTTAQVETALSEKKVADMLMDELLIKQGTIQPQNLEHIINDLALAENTAASQ
ncbi:MAG: WecB/TagA/CpsF family glycosyltransferase [Nostocaceae cyanobacterium]|nr:WecB/TagA/CpsF family glycosyltransferase [Nostocaceae cyanobacterium]